MLHTFFEVGFGVVAIILFLFMLSLSGYLAWNNLRSKEYVFAVVFTTLFLATLSLLFVIGFFLTK